MTVLAVIGGQYGSEGKGVLVAHLAQRYKYHVRVGGPNAGHSFYHDGQLWKMQSVPCGWVNPQSILIIGRGALISPEQLGKELIDLEEAGYNVRPRLFIDAGAAMINSEWHNEGHTEGELHQRIGSTGEGIGACRAARMARNPSRLERYAEWSNGLPSWKPLMAYSTSSMLGAAIVRGDSILLEGTQGVGLSLIHGPWPYTTSADVGVAALCSDTGIAPSKVDRTLMVLRTFPIRVAGNSGPLPREMTWDQMTALVGRPVVERTTVTKKIRRIGQWDERQVAQAIEMNAPTHLALTFADYLSPEDEGKTEYSKLSDKTKHFVNYLERVFRIPVAFIGTGGAGFRVVERGDRWQ